MKTSTYHSNPTVLESYPPQEYAEDSKHESSPPAKLRHLDSVGLSQMPSNQLFAIELGVYSPELGVLPPK